MNSSEHTSAKKILLVEDEPHLAFSLQFNLQAEGFEVVPAANGRVALEKYRSDGPFDLIILDVMIPEIDGFEVAREIRKSDDQTGILMLTARAAEEDRIKGLETGVDDYITKPFHLKELLLRVKRMARRAGYLAPETSEAVDAYIFKHGPFTLDVESLHLTGPQGNHPLTKIEADMLREFIRHPQRVLSREHLLEKVWGIKADIETRTVDNFIVRLRRYLEADPTNPEILVSVRGRGYRLNTIDAQKKTTD